MKKILIMTIIIIGIFGAWFIKNKGIEQVEINNDITVEQEEIKQEDNVEIEENNSVGDGALDILSEENIVTDDDIPTEGIGVGDDGLDIPLVKIDKNDPNFELSTPSFDIETLKTYGLPILLDFGASWCGPCQRMHPVLGELNSELRGRAIIKYIDIDIYPKAAKDFDFTLIPTQYFITTQGEVYKTHTGIIPKEDVINILKEMGMEE